MPFGGTFWSTGWEAVKHPHSFPNCTISTTTGSSYWKRITVDSWTTTECIQGPVNGYDGTDLSSINIGYFIGKKTTDDSVVITCEACRPETRGFTADPNLILVKLGSTDSEVSEYRRLTYWAPFSKQSSSGPPDPKFYCFFRASSVVTYELYHVQPIAFRGVVSEVIGAILMYAGVDDAYIDKDSFDDAYDAELVSGADNSERPYVWVIPEQGETVLATIKRVMGHWSHMLTYNKDGKLALRAADALTEFFSAIDGNAGIKSIKTRTNRSLILNKCIAMHMSGMVRYTDYPNVYVSHPDFNAEYEPHLKSDIKQEFIDEYSDSSSITKYGERQYGDRVRQTAGPTSEWLHTFNYPYQQNGYAEFQYRTEQRMVSTTAEGDPIKVAHYPYVYDKDIKDNIMLRFTTNEAKLRTFLEVEQDFLGLDYEIGSVVYVPSEGGDFRCISQVIDYNGLTVKSVLVRNYPTEYTTASTGVWAYADWESQPVGNSELLQTSQMVLNIDFTIAKSFLSLFQVFVSKDGAPWEELTTGWTTNTGDFDKQYVWAGTTASVEILIRFADDDGSGVPQLPTPWLRMPTATLVT